MDAHADTHRLALDQHLVVGRSQARDKGMADRTFTRALRRLGWRPRYRGIWAPSNIADHRHRIEAAVLSVGAPVLVSGASSLWLDGVLAVPPDTVELVVPLGRSPAPRDSVCIHHTSRYSDLRYRRRGNLLVAQTVHSLADHARHATTNGMVFAMADGCRLRRCTLAHVAREIEARRRFPGRTVLRIAHGLLTGELTHSGDERLGRRLLRTAGLEFASRPLTIEHQGRPIAEIDIPFTHLHYGVEIDGPPHLLPHVAAADRARDRQLGRLGWLIDRFLWIELERDPDGFVREVTKAVEQRTRQLRDRTEPRESTPRCSDVSGRIRPEATEQPAGGSTP